MYYNQQQPQLPFDTQRPMFAFLNISLNPLNPPFVPPIQTDPQIQQYLPLISAMTAIEIQQKATMNSLRTFMFNRYAVNNFMNNDFAALVSTIADYLILMLYIRRSYPNLDVAVQDAVPKVVEMTCAMGAAEFPALQQVIPPDVQAAVRDSVGMFGAISQEITAMKQRGNWPGMQQVAPAYAQPAPYLQQPPPPYGQQQPPPYRAGGYQPTLPHGATSIFRSGSQPVQRDPGTGRTIRPSEADRWAKPSTVHELSQTPQEVLAQPYTNRSQEMHNQVPPNDFTQVMAAPEDATTFTPMADANWKPTADSSIWYLPAYNPLTHELLLKKEPGYPATPHLKARSEVLDYNRHKLGTVFGPIPPALDLSHTAEIMERLAAGAKELAGEKVVREEGADYTPKAFVRQKWLAETCENNAWLTANLERIRTDEANGNPDIYRVYAKVVQPIVGVNDETEFVKNFGSSHTFIELREKLNACVNEVTPNLWGAANRKMTAIVNRILRQNLSIPKLAIESFVTDLDDLIDYLKDQYGDAVKTAFLKNQKAHITNAFVLLEQELATNLTDGLVDDREYEANSLPKITYIASNMSFTYLNCRSHELELELNAEAAAVLTQEYTPVFYKLVEELFKETDNLSNFDRHMFRTNDGRVLEATRGYLGHEVYLLTLVD